MLPAAALILAAAISKYPEVFRIFGWFMFSTSLLLYFVPREIHHKFSLKAAEFLKPFYFQLIAAKNRRLNEELKRANFEKDKIISSLFE